MKNTKTFFKIDFLRFKNFHKVFTKLSHKVLSAKFTENYYTSMKKKDMEGI